MSEEAVIAEKSPFVVELVEGETVADRIQRGPMPVEDAARVALQIAEAVESAHDNGVVHRDLKPANVKITPGGQVKVLDFGLAKAWNTENHDTSVSMSPTMTAHATAAGLILVTNGTYSISGDLNETVIDRPLILARFSSLIALAASLPSGISTNAKPRGRPVWRSLTMCTVETVFKSSSEKSASESTSRGLPAANLPLPNRMLPRCDDG